MSAPRKVTDGKAKFSHDDTTRLTIIAHHEGTMEMIAGDVTVPDADVFRVRASRILPVGKCKRLAFRVLRHLFGDRGSIASWTRRWRGPWQATILTTGEDFTHSLRGECLAWERERINHLLMQVHGNTITTARMADDPKGAL